jgi:hypothetical protein
LVKLNLKLLIKGHEVANGDKLGNLVAIEIYFPYQVVNHFREKFVFAPERELLKRDNPEQAQNN